MPTPPRCVEWATKVTQTEGMMVGPSAGAAIKYARDVARSPPAYVLVHLLTEVYLLPYPPTRLPANPPTRLPRYACDVACRPEAAGKTIVVVVPSHGIRYVQHPLWGKMKAEVCYPSYHPATTCSTNCGRCRAASPADFFTYS